MKIRNHTKTIHYKGGTITMAHTFLEFRSQCKLHGDILCWVKTDGYAKQRILIGNLPSHQPAVTLNYIRNRIKKDPVVR